MKSASNQKLTDKQIQEIKQLKSRGVRTILIAKILEAQGLSRSLAYYHLGDGYDTKSRKIRDFQKQAIKEKIAKLIDEGYNTGDIARLWNIELKVINKIYIS